MPCLRGVADAEPRAVGRLLPFKLGHIARLTPPRAALFIECGGGFFIEDHVRRPAAMMALGCRFRPHRMLPPADSDG